MSDEWSEASYLDSVPALSDAELAQRSGLTITEVHVHVECGALSPAGGEGRFSVRGLAVARTARRLREELVLDDAHALAVVLRLRQRIGELQAEIDLLRAQVWR